MSSTALEMSENMDVALKEELDSTAGHLPIALETLNQISKVIAKRNLVRAINKWLSIVETKGHPKPSNLPLISTADEKILVLDRCLVYY